MSENDSRAPEGASRSLVLSALWRGKVVIAASAVVLGAVAYYASIAQPEHYEARSTVVLSSAGPFAPLGDYQNPDPTRYIADQMAVMRSGAVLTAAAQVQGVGATAAELAEDLQLTAASDGSVITVEAGGDTGAEAAARANAVVAAYQAYVKADAASVAGLAVDAVNGQAAANDDGLNQQRATVSGINARLAQFDDGVQTVDQAVAPTTPSSPVPLRDGLIAAVVGALLAAGVVLWRRGSRPADTRTMLRGAGVPVLGALDAGSPRGPAPAVDLEGASAALLSLDFATADRAPGPVLVSDLRAGAGSADVVVALASAAVARGSSVAVISLDADPAPLLGRLGVPVVPAPLSRASEAGSFLVPAQRVTDPEGRTGCRVGRLSPRLARGGELDGVFATLLGAHDLVLLHSGPLSTSPDGYAAVRASAAVVAVVSAEDSAQEVSEAWTALGDRLVVAGRRVDGAVLTRRRRGVRRPASGSGAPALPGGAAQPKPPQRPVVSGASDR